MADDGFGVEVAARLAERELPRGVDVVDFGIRGMDLVFALGEGYDIALFVDAVPRGEQPGTVFLIEPQLHESERSLCLRAKNAAAMRCCAGRRHFSRSVLAMIVSSRTYRQRNSRANLAWCCG